MCGICGFNWDDKELIRKMCEIQSHRGPDQQGSYVDGSVSLGHLRLSIIDLSEKGKQPMSNEDGSIWIVYNGEVYNFIELKEKLLSKGHRFRSDTDTEVIVHAYEEWGEGCVNRFNGMFAFAIWDMNRKRFFLARDRSGIKPLYYYLKEGKLIFASEIKAILQHEFIKREVDKEALYNYLTFRYMPGEKSIFHGINKLLPGHTLTYDKNGESVNKFWDISFNPIKRSIKDYAKQVDLTLKESIKKRLISDVPLGSFLSGGLDSSYVVGLMSKLVDEPIKTFSIGFRTGDGYDETKFSRLVSEFYGTDHNEIFVEGNSFELLPKILWHMDEPIADFASIPTYILSEFAKKKVSVVMTGEGADEIFGGYRKYKYLNAFKPYHNLMPNTLRKMMSDTASIFNKSSFYKRMQEFHSAKTTSEYYLQLISFFTNYEKQGLCKENLLKSIQGRPDLDIVKNFFDKNMLNSLMALDFKTWLPEDVLMKVDKTTMAHALEARVPFLDPNMLQFTSQIPSNLKLRLNQEKYILRQAMKGTVPDIIYKRKKHGFNVPIHRWLEEDLKDVSRGLLSKENIKKRELFDPNYVEKLFNNYHKSKVYYSRQIWTLLNFEIWARIYLDRDDIKKENWRFNDLL